MIIAPWEDCSPSPAITVGQGEHRRLTTAALVDVTGQADDVEFLLYELDRARVVEDAKLPTDIVRLQSIVRFKATDGCEMAVKLVLPENASHQNGFRLSVTSRYGAALLGLRPGQTLTWNDPEGRTGKVEVISVFNAN